MINGTVVFDLDGTLADTSADLLAAANAALTQGGFAPALERGRDDAVAFAGGRAMLRLGFERLGVTAEVDPLYPVLLKAYAGAIDVHTVLYPGVEDALGAMSDRPLAVCTNKPEGLARTLLTRLDVLDRFQALIGADTLPTRKPHPEPFAQSVIRAGGDPARAVLVGDTITDRKTAQAAGVPCILVGFAPEGRAAMEALKPEAILDDYADLPELAARILGD